MRILEKHSIEEATISVTWEEFYDMITHARIILSIESGYGDSYVHVHGPFVIQEDSHGVEFRSRKDSGSVAYIRPDEIKTIDMHVGQRVCMLNMKYQNVITFEYRR